MFRMTAFTLTHARSLIGGVALAALAAVGPSAQAQPVPDLPATRGQLLYSTHCIECHTAQMHWRTNRQARDWDTLKAQVRRWQGVANLGWSDADIDDVARYLNDTIYRFPLQLTRLGAEADSAAPWPVGQPAGGQSLKGKGGVSVSKLTNAAICAR